MEQKEIVEDFIKSLGQMTPAIINAEFIKYYVTKIVIDSKSLEQFIVETDRYLKHSQTFQMGFLLHSVSSVLCFSPLGSPVDQVKNMIPTDAFRMTYEESYKLKDLSESKRYESLCQKLMDDTKESRSLEAKVSQARRLDKLDDGGTIKNPLFNPMKTKFSKDKAKGEDLTEELEV